MSARHTGQKGRDSKISITSRAHPEAREKPQSATRRRRFVAGRCMKQVFYATKGLSTNHFTSTGSPILPSTDAFH